MVYADKCYYIVDYDGKVIPMKKVTHFQTLAKKCINLYLPDIDKKELPKNIQRCSCVIADILYGYCKENNLVIKNSKELMSQLIDVPNLNARIKNAIILYLQRAL